MGARVPTEGAARDAPIADDADALAATARVATRAALRDILAANPTWRSKPPRGRLARGRRCRDAGEIYRDSNSNVDDQKKT
jgi:hypothetical protein